MGEGQAPLHGQKLILQWYVIPLFALVVYVYANEVEKRNWNLVSAGLAFWGTDWFNEIWNSLVQLVTSPRPLGT